MIHVDPNRREYAMRKLVLPFAAVTVAAALAFPADGAARTVTLTAKLSGKKEVPGPGDPNGRGKAVIRLNAARAKVCYVITYSKINGSSAAHIHTGAKGVAGDVLVALYGTQTSKSRVKGCAFDVPTATIKSIKSNPKGFYVNVHNTDFPNGAIRGQLRKA
jgi:CHRD domain-containing protein